MALANLKFVSQLFLLYPLMLAFTAGCLHVADDLRWCRFQWNHPSDSW